MASESIIRLAAAVYVVLQFACMHLLLLCIIITTAIFPAERVCVKQVWLQFSQADEFMWSAESLKYEMFMHPIYLLHTRMH